MKQFGNGVSAMPPGFSAVSSDELNHVEGGAAIVVAAAALAFYAGFLTGYSLMDAYLDSRPTGTLNGWSR